VTVHGDGSAIRDYVHVEDIARAHVQALEKPGVYNLGSGRGTSVLEVIETARRVTGRPIEVRFGPPRPGDPQGLVADITRARRPRSPQRNSSLRALRAPWPIRRLIRDSPARVLCISPADSLILPVRYFLSLSVGEVDHG
jgi:hypothetical protein